MALTWERRRIMSSSDLYFDNHVLAQIPAGVTLKRTIVSWYVRANSSEGVGMDFWSVVPMVWAVQVTYGEPPGFPINPATDDPNATDILDWGVTKMGAERENYTYSSTTNNNAAVGHIDTPAQRRSFTYPSVVWFTWGATYTSEIQIARGLTRAATSVLLDDHT